MNNKNINKFVVYKDSNNDISFNYYGITFRLFINGRWGTEKIAYLYYKKNDNSECECLKACKLSNKYAPYLSITFNLVHQRSRVIVREKTIKQKMDLYETELWEACKSVIEQL